MLSRHCGSVFSFSPKDKDREHAQDGEVCSTAPQGKPSLAGRASGSDLVLVTGEQPCRRLFVLHPNCWLAFRVWESD